MQEVIPGRNLDLIEKGHFANKSAFLSV